VQATVIEKLEMYLLRKEPAGLFRIIYVRSHRYGFSDNSRTFLFSGLEHHTTVIEELEMEYTLFASERTSGPFPYYFRLLAPFFFVFVFRITELFRNIYCLLRKKPEALFRTIFVCSHLSFFFLFFG
jgi:hypothetical protein